MSIFSRSRRKGELNKENRNNANQPGTTSQMAGKKTGVVSASHSSTVKARKAPSSETCVADSFDDAMLDKLTEIPYAVDRNEWLAMHSKLSFSYSKRSIFQKTYYKLIFIMGFPL